MKFLADMCVPLRAVEWLRKRNHDVAHARDLTLGKASDSEIFLKADIEGRIVLTFDLDFGEIAAASGNKLPSVVTLRLHNTNTTHVIERLETALDSAADALEKGAIVIVEESRIRIRRLPIFKDTEA